MDTPGRFKSLLCYAVSLVPSISEMESEIFFSVRLFSFAPAGSLGEKKAWQKTQKRGGFKTLKLCAIFFSAFFFGFSALCSSLCAITCWCLFPHMCNEQDISTSKSLLWTWEAEDFLALFLFVHFVNSGKLSVTYVKKKVQLVDLVSTPANARIIFFYKCLFMFFFPYRHLKLQCF